MNYSFFQFLSEQWKPVPPVVQDDLEGKTIVITGASSGLGFEAAKHFGGMDPGRLVLACRNRTLGEAAVSHFDSVRAFCDTFVKGQDRLDILIQNAGVINNLEARYTKDGWSEDLQVNNLSAALISLLLLPMMLKTEKTYGTTPRLVIVGSAVHHRAKFDQNMIDSKHPLRAYNKPEYYNGIPRVKHYFDTKLLNILFARALDERVKSSHSIIINCVNPGYCASRLRRTVNVFAKAGDWMGDRLLAHTAEEGSRQLVWGAIGGIDAQAALRGAYISLSQVCEPSAYVMSEEGNLAQNKIWDSLIEELSTVEPQIVAIVKEHLR